MKMRSFPATFIRAAGLLMIALVFSGCATLVEKSGEALEGCAFTEKTAVLYRSDGRASSGRIELRKIHGKNGEDFVKIENSSVPGLAITGSLPGNDGGFELLEAHFLSSHSSGWNEFTLDLLGRASLQNTEGGAVLRFPSPAERVQVSSGKIRLKSSRISGGEALRNLRNRRERILAVVEWMRDRPSAPRINTREDFENYWKSILFPELVSRKKRPGDYTNKNAEWVRSNGVKWNKTYTELIFPEWLWELRNSGALLRDWEEASSWMFLEYNWDLINRAFDGITLKKIRGE